jgi:hypothetical protein
VLHDLAPGQYAFSAHHDLNGNGQLGTMSTTRWVDNPWLRPGNTSWVNHRPDWCAQQCFNACLKAP